MTRIKTRKKNEYSSHEAVLFPWILIDLTAGKSLKASQTLARSDLKATNPREQIG